MCQLDKMANNNNDVVAEYLVFLKQNAGELRKLGKKWGMTEEEIDNCVTEALSRTENQDKLRKSPKNKARKCWSYFLVFMKVQLVLGLLLIGIFGAVYVTASYHEPTERALVKIVMPYSYNIMRFVRLAAVPLHKIFNISSLYHEDCLVYNPFYIEIPPDCNICRTFKQIKGINATNFTSMKFTAYANTMKPVKVMNTLKWNVTYSNLRTIFLEMQDDLVTDPQNFKSSIANIQSLGDLFNDDRQDDVTNGENIHIGWHSRTVRASAGLRKLFPRPPYLPPESEITLEKHVLIDGPNTTTYRMPAVHSSPLQMFIVGSGRRRLLMRPLDACEHQCNSMLVFMEAGDSVLYNRDLWNAYLATNGDEPSVGYVLAVQI